MPVTIETRVKVMHANPFLAIGLAQLIAKDDALDIGDADAAVDVVVADHATGLRLLEDPVRPKVMIVATQLRGATVRQALDRGAEGYLTIDCTPDETIAAIKQVAAGHRHVCAAAARRLAEARALEPLTRRETEVMQLVAKGHGNKSIARDLQIETGTVKSHVKALLSKLRASTRTQAVVHALHRGLIDEFEREFSSPRG